MNISEIYLLSEMILMVSLVIFAFASVRLVSKKYVASGLVGTAGFGIAGATILVLISEIYNIGFCKDIAFALLLLDPVGTIAFSSALRGE